MHMPWFALVVSPLLVAFGGFVVWFLQSRIEQVRTLERNLQGDRRKVYADILDPFIRLFANMKNQQEQERAAAMVLTYEYRKTAFDLNLFGADNVVKAYNEMMQHAYKAAEETQDSTEMMRLWGTLLLEIRKSLGNPSKELNEWDMLRGMVNDIDSFI
jgi:flagellar basal body-associated protein FliL